MKKLFTLIMTVTMVAALSVTTMAQGRDCRRANDSRTYNSQAYDSRAYDSQSYYDNSGGYYDSNGVYRDRSFWNRHRDKLTVLAGTAGGAAIGGLIGGKKGAVVGAAAGLGGSALYAYKIRHRNTRF